jgi:hypothetical protein
MRVKDSGDCGGTLVKFYPGIGNIMGAGSEKYAGSARRFKNTGVFEDRLDGIKEEPGKGGYGRARVVIVEDTPFIGGGKPAPAGIGTEGV